MKLAALIFGDDDRQPKTAAGKSPEPGQIVRSIDGSVYRVASKIAGPDGVVVKLANLQGKPVQTPNNFRPVGLAVARFASWLRYHLAFQKDFDLYVNAYIEQYNKQHQDKPLPYPIGQDGKPFRWANFFQKKISPKLYVRGHGNAGDQQAVKDDIIHEMLFNTLGERHVLDQFVKAKKRLGVSRQNEAAKLTDFLISTFMYRIDEMQNKLNARSPEEEISLYQPAYHEEEGESEKNILDTDEYATHDEEFQGAEARKDVARFRESFRKWLGHTAGPKASEAFILMFDIFWRLLQMDESGDVKRNELQDEWMEKTGLSFGSFKDYFSRLPEMMEGFITTHATELGEHSVFVDLMNTIRAERTERERKERRQKQKARPATVSSLHIAEGVEEDFAEAQKNSVSPMKLADGIGGDLAQAISNTENPDVVDPDIKQPTKTVPEAAKQADYTQQDWEQDEASEAWLDKVHDAENEAKRVFMQDTDMQQEAANAEMTMEQLWAELGEDFTNEYWAPRTASVKTAGLVRGDQLTPEMLRQVQDAFMYRWTKDNKRRAEVYHCDKCDVANNPFQGSNAEGHQHPTIPLQSDEEWLKEHAFYFTNAGKLQPRRHAVPAYLAPEPEGLFASVAHKFAMEKSLKQADYACCGGFEDHKADCSVKDTDSTSKHTSGISDRYMSPQQMIQEFTRPNRKEEEEKRENVPGPLEMRHDPASGKKKAMIPHEFNNADGQAIRNETYPSTDYVSGEADTTELRQRRASHEIWECMDCGQKGELDPKGGTCATCGSQAVARVDQSKPADVTPIREPNPMEVEKRMIPIREKQIAPGGRLSAADKTAQGSGNTTVTMQEQNVTSPNIPGKGQPMAVPEAIDQAAGPHSPNAPQTAPRTPGIQPKIVNVPPGTEGEEGMANMASKRANGFEELFGDILSEYACPKCGSMNVDVTPTEDGYDIYCEDCEQVTPSHGGEATPGVSGLHATEPEIVDPDLEMEPEEPPFEVTSSFVRTAAINVSQGQDAQGFHMNINMNGREYVLRGDDAEQFRREYAAIPKPEGKVNALVEKYLNKLQPYGQAAPQPRQQAPKQKAKQPKLWGIPDWLKRKQEEEALSSTAAAKQADHNPYETYDRLKKDYDDKHEVSYEDGRAKVVEKKQPEEKTADALFEEQPLADVTDIDMLYSMPEERKAEWLKAHGWSPDESHHEPAWWLREPQWSKDGHEEDIPYQGTDEAIEKELALQEKEDEHIESQGIGCRQCGAVLNNAEGELCGQCQAEGAEDREDPFDKMSTEEGEDKMQVAKTILEQLGGNKFRAMTGAKNFVGGQNNLTFRLPGSGGFTKDGINAVQITLEPSDTYTVAFSRIRGGDAKVISMHRDVYAENLREVFERATGLATSLGTMGKRGAGSNSGEDDPRGVGTNYNDEFYEHRTKGLSSDGMLSGMKEAAPVALNAPAPPVLPNVQQNMNLVRPQVMGQPGGTEVAISPGQGGAPQEDTNIGKHTVEPELPNSKYHMMGSLIAAEEKRLMAAAGLKQCKECGTIDPSVDEYEDGNYCTECASGQTKEASGQFPTNSFKVTFEDGNSLVTNFNGTLQEAKDYYLNNVFNFGDVDEPDHLVKGTSVESVMTCAQCEQQKPDVEMMDFEPDFPGEPQPYCNDCHNDLAQDI